MFFGLFGLLFPDCVPEVGPDTGWDTAEPKAVFLDGVTFGCDVLGWSYELTALTLVAEDPPDSGTVTMQLIDTGYYEEHPLPEPVLGETSVTWLYEFDLERVYSEEDLIPGVTTMLPCTDVDAGMNWHIEAINEGDSDCAVFGTDPEAMGFTECSIWVAG